MVHWSNACVFKLNMAASQEVDNFKTFSFMSKIRFLITLSTGIFFGSNLDNLKIVQLCATFKSKLVQFFWKFLLNSWIFVLSQRFETWQLTMVTINVPFQMRTCNPLEKHFAIDFMQLQCNSILYIKRINLLFKWMAIE